MQTKNSFGIIFESQNYPYSHLPIHSLKRLYRPFAYLTSPRSLLITSWLLLIVPPIVFKIEPDQKLV